MNITPIFFNLGKTKNTESKYSDNRLIKPSYKNQLTQDTVSFTAKTKLADSVMHSLKMDAPRLKRIATIFLDVTESIVFKFDELTMLPREILEATAVKAPTSKFSKINRNKSFDIRDSIRTTVFMKNPYDLSVLFDKVLPAYAERGYIVADVEMPMSDLIKRGYVPVEEEMLIKNFFEIPHDAISHKKFFLELKKKKYDYTETKAKLSEVLASGKEPTYEDIKNIVKTLKKSVPDLDLRLDNKLLKKLFPDYTLHETYKYSLGKPQGSGYEDIQIRFKRINDKNPETPVLHELLIQFGQNYNENAILEHGRVYEPLRALGELYLPIKGAKFGSPAQLVDRYIELTKNKFRNIVSENLILNAKNEDFYGIKEENPIYFEPLEIRNHEDRFKQIIKNLNSYYQKITSGKMDSETKAKIKSEWHDDLKLVRAVKKELDSTIRYFNEEYSANLAGN